MLWILGIGFQIDAVESESVDPDTDFVKQRVEDEF